MNKCRKCNHIFDPSEPHVCPTLEYLAARNVLVAAAARAEAEISDEELEDYARRRPR